MTEFFRFKIQRNDFSCITELNLNSEKKNKSHNQNYDAVVMMSVFGILQQFLPNNNMSLRWRRNKSTIICIAGLLFLAGITIILLTSTQRYCFHTTFLWTGLESDVAKKVDAYHDKKTNKLYVHKFSNNVSSEYIKLIKVYNSTLTFHDLLYESKRNNNKRDYFSAYSVTGNFRSKSYKTWDPHPEYKFTVFGNPLHLILHQDNSFITPSTFHVIRILKTRTEIQNDQDHYLGCYYKGYVQGDSQSTVAVSLCNGMTGHIKTTFGSFLIQPLKNVSDNQNEVLHRVWKHSNRPVRFVVSENAYRNRNFVKQNTAAQLTRNKRNYVDNHLFTMEVLVAVDKTMSDFHNGELKSYILTLMSIVSNIFADASIGNSIYISVPNILILKDDIVTSRGEKNISASQLLKHFCSFLKKRGVQYDTAIMLTRDQICRNKREPKCDTLGLAELGTVCKRYSCSIVQDNGLPAAFTIAHELGHILNMPHDDDSRCGNFKQRGRNTLHIMSSTMGDDIHPWSWSDCSRHYVSEFLEKEDTTCLEDTPQVSISSDDPKFAGELYSLDQQCRLIHGNFSKYCSIEMECARLWCKADLNLADCRSSNLPWADGTPCKNKYYWCQKGKCILREGIKHQVTNGGWGPWSSFTPCSMTCGGGVQESQRECNNPFPKNGGKYCAGSRKKYRSCNTQNCPSGSLDSREQQCYNMNGNDFGIKGVNSSVKWIPKYGLTGNDKCKLYCRWDTTSAYFQLGDKVRDGTTCSFDSFDKCVNGICRQAGCDNELNSMATLDKCGVCEGRNNTCEEFSGNFYKSDISNKTNSLYYYVTTIPKGSSNIVITQPGYHTQNYIVLRNASGGSLLNGDRVINTYRHIFFYAGVSFEYNGSHSTLERVNTSYSRKLKSDLIVEIISLNLETIKNDSILLSYSYTTDKHDNAQNSDLYQWELKEWSTCDALCQGTSFQISSCISLETGLKVPKPFCDSTQKPIPQSRSCNMSCHLTLNIAGISDCSATCGMFGKRKKSYFCIQTYTNNSRSNIVDLAYCEPKFEINLFEECSEGCWNYTAWSPCSQSCGVGQQTRSVVCFLNQTQVSDSLCNLQELSSYDEVSRFCNLKPCRNWIPDKKYEAVESNWITEEWGFCNDNCEKNRTVDCSDGYGCAIETKPIEKKKCCSVKYIATWSPCSVECGNGTKKKEFYCARVYKSEIKSSRRIKVETDSKFCSKLKVPIPRRAKKSCKISCKWIADKWTTCSGDCRTEFQTRTITCATSNYRQISSKYCEPNKKPVARRMCSQCIRRTFKITKCNCEGYRRRRVICTDANGKRISCPNKQKIVKDKCQIPEECLPKSCIDIKRFHKLFVDKDYTIFVREKPKKIYCHNMNGKPKEYITLNPLENYSIYYDNKTKLPEMCPPEARSMEYNDKSIRNGRTHFRKISINITSLHIVENDFTFADTVGFPQPFGSAGDCYNKNRKCPQGDFSINFKYTGFSINSKTRWETVGNNVIMKLSNESTMERRALCGGYCGRCSISARTGLALDV